jgi:ubiquinone/menaquinone biosynthesis C-methylase UbiE
MKPEFNINLEQILLGKDTVVLDLGCGDRPHPGRIGIDRLSLPGVDIVADLEEGLHFLPENSIDSIYSKSFLEHIENLDNLMREIWRVLKPNGTKHLFVPHFSNPYFYSDYTHKHFFGLYSFEYFSKNQKHFHRKVPSFYHADINFNTEMVILKFTSPWRLRNLIKRGCEKIFNFKPGWQEFYEENLCYVFPCYGIQATLRAIKE